MKHSKASHDDSSEYVVILMLPGYFPQNPLLAHVKRIQCMQSIKRLNIIL